MTSRRLTVNPLFVARTAVTSITAAPEIPFILNMDVSALDTGSGFDGHASQHFFCRGGPGKRASISPWRATLFRSHLSLLW